MLETDGSSYFTILYMYNIIKKFIISTIDTMKYLLAYSNLNYKHVLCTLYVM